MPESKDPVLKILAHQRHYLNLLPKLNPRGQREVYRHIRKLNRKLGEVYREGHLSEEPGVRGTLVEVPAKPERTVHNSDRSHRRELKLGETHD